MSKNPNEITLGELKEKLNTQGFNFGELIKNPDIVKFLGAKNIVFLVKNYKKIEKILENPEFYLGEFEIAEKRYMGILIRKKDEKHINNNNTCPC